MSAGKPDQQWQVTYFNVGLGLRCNLIDRLDESQASAVVERFGETGDEFHRLPQVRKEPMATGEAA